MLYSFVFLGDDLRVPSTRDCGKTDLTTKGSKVPIVIGNTKDLKVRE